MIDLANFSPIADVLILDKRTCRHCGFGSYQPSRIMRLWTSHTGPHQHMIVPRKPDETPLPARGTKVVETVVDSCMNCWKPTHTIEDLEAHVPPVPTACGQDSLGRNGSFSHTVEAVLARSALASREARARVAAALHPSPMTKNELESLL